MECVGVEHEQYTCLGRENGSGAEGVKESRGRPQPIMAQANVYGGAILFWMMLHPQACF